MLSNTANFQRYVILTIGRISRRDYVRNDCEILRVAQNDKTEERTTPILSPISNAKVSIMWQINVRKIPQIFGEISSKFNRRCRQ